jgi:hypothetical protein
VMEERARLDALAERIRSALVSRPIQ